MKISRVLFVFFFCSSAKVFSAVPPETEMNSVNFILENLQPAAAIIIVDSTRNGAVNEFPDSVFFHEYNHLHSAEYYSLQLQECMSIKEVLKNRYYRKLDGFWIDGVIVMNPIFGKLKYKIDVLKNDLSDYEKLWYAETSLNYLYDLDTAAAVGEINTFPKFFRMYDLFFHGVK